LGGPGSSLWPSTTAEAMSVSGTVGAAGVGAEQLERVVVVDAVACHQDALRALDDGPASARRECYDGHWHSTYESANVVMFGGLGGVGWI
jgi:hypothetical protein